MSAHVDPRHVLVVGIDFEADGDRALDAAVAYARNRPGTEIHVLYVDQITALANAAEADVATRTEVALDELEARCQTRLDSLAAEASGLRRVATHYRLGNAAEQLVQFAGEIDADLVVVGTHDRRGVKRLLLGSVAAAVLKMARCPVLVARLKDHEGIGEVPAIEPPCPDCVRARESSANETWWCERHATARRPLAHRYSYVYSSSSERPAPWGAAFD
jgi:nucleotide-binding universal stress UspA family protein